MAIRIADFKCNSCGDVSEILFKTDDIKVSCPSCECTEMTRLIGAPKIVDGVKSLGRQTPDGFKEVLKHVNKTTPDSAKAAKFTAL